MDLLASYDDGDNSGTNSPFTKKDEQKPVSPTASLQAEWESFEKMIGGGNDELSEKEEPVSADQYLVGGIVAYPGMGQITTEHKDSSVDGAHLSPERKKGRSLADDVMKLLSSSNLSEELDMPPRRRSHSSDSSRSSSSDRSESKSPSESPERETEAKDGTPEHTEERLGDTDHKESRQRTTSNASATSVDERSSAHLEKSSRSPKRRRSRSRSPARRKRSRSSRSRNRSGSRSRKRSRERKKSPSHRSRDRRHKKDRRSSRDRRKRRGKESKRHSRSRDRHHKRSHKRSRSRSPRHKRRRSRSRSRSRERTHRSRSRSHDRSHRSRSRSRERQHRVDHGRPGSSREDGEKHLTFKEKMRQQLLKASKYLQAGESIEGIDGKSLDVPKEKPSKLPLNDKSFFAAMAASTASGVTPQMALIQTMAAMHQKAQEMTGVAVPKYYNPAAVNPLKYAEQVQKRKLLWSKNKDKKDDKEKEWEHTAFVSDQGGKVAAKFRKLMGIKHEGQEEEDSTTEVSEEQKKKHDELFSRLDKEYEFARMATHTHRGVGLGFSSQGYPAT